jgi:imidazolonepropionase
MKILFQNIRQLIQVRETSSFILKGAAMKELPLIENAYLLVEDGFISGFGKMEEVPAIAFDEVVDCSGKILLPTWIDTHTHLVFAQHREQEFVDRINGLTYQEIAAKGGGILNSAKKLQEATEEDLYQNAAKRLQQIIQSGTGAIEIKTGYGLELEAEIKMLRVIERLRKNFSIPIKITFLGAHAIPASYQGNQDAFVEDLLQKYFPEVHALGLVDYFDAFLETGYFSVKNTQRLIQEAKKYGWKSKIHVNQFTAIGGIAMCAEEEVITVDHLEIITSEDIIALKSSNTIPVALPICSFFIGIPYTPARQILQNDLPLVIASDYNPGTSPSANMHFAMALGCIQMKLTPEESINACTYNAAFAIELEKEIGSFTIGKKANFIITKPLKHYNEIPYLFTENIVEQVWINGKLF